MAVEWDKSAYKTLVSNILALVRRSSARCYCQHEKAWSQKNADKQFDLVICDPPYDAVLALEIERLVRHVKTNGLLVLSWPAKLVAPPMPGCDILTEKEYAGARIVFYRKS